MTRNRHHQSVAPLDATPFEAWQAEWEQVQAVKAEVQEALDAGSTWGTPLEEVIESMRARIDSEAS